MITTYTYLAVFTVAGVTALSRAIPFLFFQGRTIPRQIKNLGLAMPQGIMMVLVLYSIRTPKVPSIKALEVLCVLLAMGLQAYKKNTFLSIFLSTIVYMIFIRILA